MGAHWGQVDILNIGIDNLTRSEFLRRLQSGVVFTPNVDHLVRLQHDRHFYECYQQADWIICDSRILYFLSHLLPVPICESIPGSSFFPEFCHFHAKDDNTRIFILGGKEGIAQKAMENINNRIGRRIAVGALSPSFSINRNESRRIADVINQSDATVVLTGLGAPKQEKWIIAHRHLMPRVRIWLALGATIDFEAETLSRAPKAWRKLGMEWFYRFLHEPKRLFHRYFVDDMTFFWHFGRQLLHIYHNPWQENQT